MYFVFIIHIETIFCRMKCVQIQITYLAAYTHAHTYDEHKGRQYRIFLKRYSSLNKLNKSIIIIINCHKRGKWSEVHRSNKLTSTNRNLSVNVKFKNETTDHNTQLHLLPMQAYLSIELFYGLERVTMSNLNRMAESKLAHV